MKREWVPVDHGVAIFRRPGSFSWYLNIEQDGRRQQSSLKTRDRSKALAIAQDHAHLRGLQNLKSLNLTATQVTVAGVQELKEAMPNLSTVRVSKEIRKGSLKR